MQFGDAPPNTSSNTTTTLAASSTTVQLGQAVTFTATVSPIGSSNGPAVAGLGWLIASGVAQVPTGYVTFSSGGTTLCSNVPLVNGVATCTHTFSSAGGQSVMATYSGNGVSSSSSTSAAFVITIIDGSQQTVNAIGKFLGSRINQLLSNEPDGRRQINRLLEAGGGTGTAPDGAGLAADSDRAAGSGPMPGLSSRLGAGPTAGDLSGLRGASASRPLSDAIAGNAAGGSGFGPNGSGSGSCGLPGTGFGRGGVGGPVSGLAGRLGIGVGSGDPCAAGSGGTVVMNGMRFNGMTEGAPQFGFSTSLRDIARSQAEADARKASAASYDLASRTGAAGVARPDPFDLWVEVKAASFGDAHYNNDRDGRFSLVSIGADYVVNPSLLIGTMVQIDSMQLRSNAEMTDARGTGSLVGPYATLRLSQNVFWQLRGAWGQSSNQVSPFQTFADNFDSTRWLVSSTLTGRWMSGPWSFTPAASIAFMEDASRSYISSGGTLIPDVKASLGQAKAGPDVGYRIDLGHTVIEPHAGVEVLWNFARDISAAGFGQIEGEGTGPDGVRGRVEAGVRAKASNGMSLDVSASYDGIGASGGYNAVTGRALLRVPLN